MPTIFITRVRLKASIAQRLFQVYERHRDRTLSRRERPRPIASNIGSRRLARTDQFGATRIIQRQAQRKCDIRSVID
jgi:hypothetical protein